MSNTEIEWQRQSEVSPSGEQLTREVNETVGVAVVRFPADGEGEAVGIERGTVNADGAFVPEERVESFEFDTAEAADTVVPVARRLAEELGE